MDHLGQCFRSKFTAAFSDGRALYAVRYASDGVPPTLYTHPCAPSEGILVVSEPLDEARDGWHVVPAQTALKIVGSEVHAQPFDIPVGAMRRPALVDA